MTKYKLKNAQDYQIEQGENQLTVLYALDKKVYSKNQADGFLKEELVGVCDKIITLFNGKKLILNREQIKISEE